MPPDGLVKEHSHVQKDMIVFIWSSKMLTESEMRPHPKGCESIENALY